MKGSSALKNMHRKEHIALFSANYYPSMGGVEKYTQNLSNALWKLNCRTTVFTSNVYNLSGYEKLNEGQTIVRLPCYSFMNGRLPVSKKNQTYNHLLRRALNERYTGVVVNTRFYRHSIEGLRFAQALGITPILIDHGSAYLTLGNPIADIAIRAYENQITAAGKRFGAEYYAVSQKSADWLKHFGISCKGIVENAIDAKEFRDKQSNRAYRDEFNIDPSTLVIAFTGRLIPEKGISQIVEAAKILQYDHVDCIFLVAGEGPLSKLIKDSNLNNLVPLGRLSEGDVSALLMQADLFCLPTRSEGFSTSLLEASACGTPSLITDVGGARELIPSSDYGTILSSLSGRELARSISELNTMRNRLADQGKKAQALVETQFSWEKTAKKIILACNEANS